MTTDQWLVAADICSCGKVAPAIFAPGRWEPLDDDEKGEWCREATGPDWRDLLIPTMLRTSLASGCPVLSGCCVLAIADGAIGDEATRMIYAYADRAVARGEQGALF